MNNNQNDDIFQIAAKAHKLLQEILSANKSNKELEQLKQQQPQQPVVKQEPNVNVSTLTTLPQCLQSSNQTYENVINNSNQHFSEQFHGHQSSHYYQQPQLHQQSLSSVYPVMNTQTQYIYQHPPASMVAPTQQNPIISPTYYMHHPPPSILPATASSSNTGPTIVQQPFYYQTAPQTNPAIRSNYYHAYNTYPHHSHALTPSSSTNHTPVVQMQQQHHHHYYQPNTPLSNVTPHLVFNNTNNNNPYLRKRKFAELNNFDNSSNINKSCFNSYVTPNSINSYNSYQTKPISYFTNNNYSPNSSTNGDSLHVASNLIPSSSNDNESLPLGTVLNEEEDLNLMRERELKELKCKSVVEKMSVFLKYYHQFREAYISRVQSIECSDSLKLQFHSLVKYLGEYENLLAELNMIITEHERDHCKNNHRKTKKFFNKTKAFIRYECNKRLQSNIFEYRRLINSQDRYAGMYDLLDMNNYLISLLPDIGVSIRRYINRCEKAREQEQFEEEEDYQQTWHSEENSTDSNLNESNCTRSLLFSDVNDLKIPTFKEFVSMSRDDAEFDDPDDHDDEEEEDEEEEEEEDEEDDDIDELKENKSKKLRKKLTIDSGTPQSTGNSAASNNHHERFTSTSHRTYESFSKGIDLLNRYLLKRVDEEESLDELVKERIIKWINKRQAKYILIFSEVDKLLNQHKTGECYSKFHSYLLFNLGKLVTVCDSYHQKLKELLYSTTIRRKKKRKKVKLLPEAMADVFDEIIDLKRALEHAKLTIKRCNMTAPKEIINKQY